jgi:hypothetical protein
VLESYAQAIEIGPAPKALILGELCSLFMFGFEVPTVGTFLLVS